MDILFIAASGILTTYIPRQWTTTTVSTTPMPSTAFPNVENVMNHSPNSNFDTDEMKNFPSLSSSSISYSPVGTCSNDLIFSLNSTTNSMLFTISLGLSLLLFSLNILELFPPSWLLWIVTRKSDNTATITTTTTMTTTTTTTISITDLYRIILWITTIHCMIIIPSSMGIAMIMRLYYPTQVQNNITSELHTDCDTPSRSSSSSVHGNLDVEDVEDRKKRNGPLSNRHWTVRVFHYTLSTSIQITISTMSRYLIRPLYRAIQYYIVIPVVHKFRWCCHCRASFLPTTTTSYQHHFHRSYILRCWYDRTLRKCIFYGSFIGISISTVLLQSIYPLVIEQQHPHQDLSHGNILLHCIKCLCAIGIIISTILNGFGSISLPYTCIAGLFLEPIPSDIIRNADMELEKVKVGLNNKIQDLITTSSAAVTVPLGSINSSSSNATSPPKSSSSFWMIPQKRGVRRNVSDYTNDATSLRRQKTTTLISEIEFLENLIDEMTINVDEMHYTQSISAEARTSFGKFRSYIGIFFSVLLLSRLLAALTNVGKQYLANGGLISSVWRLTPATSITTATNIDLVTRIVIWVSGRNVATTETLRSISQCISLLLTALLSFSQMRIFLRTITTLQRRMNKLYRKCYCQPFRLGSNICRNNYQRSHKVNKSNSFTASTTVSYMSLQSNLSPMSSIDCDLPNNGSSGNVPEYNIWFLSHPISFWLCCYCLACIVLTKMMLPTEYRINFSNALSVLTPSNTNNHNYPIMTDTIFTIRTYTIDLLYSITALITGTILAITLSFMRSNIRRLQSYSSHNLDSGVNRSTSFPAAPKSLNRALDGV